MLVTGSTWSNAGSAVNFAPDGQGEMTAVGTATGLSPLTQYQFRAIIADGSSGSSFAITTETITCTTPTAAGGEPGQLKYIYGSCANSSPSDPSTHPHKVMSAIRDEAPHGFIHLGDMMYADFEGFYAKGDEEPGIRAAYRKAFLHDFDHRRLHESTAFFPMWDDHEIADGAWGADPLQADLFARANAAAAAYWVDRRINAIDGGKGWWFDTAKCRFVMMDMRTAKHTGETTTPPGTTTMLGSTQLNAVKSKLFETGKPINFLFSPGPMVIGHGTGAGADGWNQTAMTGQRDEILQHFYDNIPTGSILIICSGDRHYTYVATDWAGSTPYDGRVKPEWCSSCLAFRQREPANLSGGGSTVQYVEPDLDFAVINRYCRIKIDEEELEVTMTLVDGATGNPMHANAISTYTASE